MKVAFKNTQDSLNPREYIKSAPIPLTSHKGVKIQARSYQVYNAFVPVRDEIRKENYKRRYEQKRSQGFSSPANKPYKVLGDPLYLDQKDIILYGLGQLNRPDDKVTLHTQQSFNLSQEDKSQESNDKNQKPKFSFKDLKKDKELLDLNAELTKTKRFLKDVKLGHSFFELIKNEEKQKQQKIEAQKRATCMEMQIRPIYDSTDDSDELSDEDYDNDNNTLNNFEEPSLVDSQDALKIQKEISFHIAENQNDISKRPHTVGVVRFNNNSAKMPSRMTLRSTRRVKSSIVPYTPVYSSFISPNENNLNRDLLYRHLCVVLWLLDSLNVSPPNVAAPLSFSLSNINESLDERFKKKINFENSQKGWTEFAKKSPRTIKYYNKSTHPRDNKIMKKKQLKEQQQTTVRDIPPTRSESVLTSAEETNDEDFDIQKRKSTPNSEYHQNSPNEQSPKKIIHNQFSTDASESVSSEMTNVNIPENSTNRQDPTRQSIGSLQDAQSTLREPINLQLNLGETYRDSTYRESYVHSSDISRRAKSVTLTRQKQISLRMDKNDKGKEYGLSRHQIETLKIGDPEEMEKIFASIGSNENKNSKALRADVGPIKPLWSEKVHEYQRNAPSNKKAERLQELKDAFVNVINENEIIVNNQLEELSKKRIKTCLAKFRFMNPTEPGLHRMIKNMHMNIIKKQKEEDKAKTHSSKYHVWYLELEELVNSIEDDSVLNYLLKKIEVYGKLNSRKMNETEFFKILNTLKVWELLSPEVMGAVEFCRDKILGIKLDNFDSWFQSKHPQVFVARLDEKSASTKRSKSSIKY